MGGNTLRVAFAGTHNTKNMDETVVLTELAAFLDFLDRFTLIEKEPGGAQRALERLEAAEKGSTTLKWLLDFARDQVASSTEGVEDGGHFQCASFNDGFFPRLC